MVSTTVLLPKIGLFLEELYLLFPMESADHESPTDIVELFTFVKLPSLLVPASPLIPMCLVLQNGFSSIANTA